MRHNFVICRLWYGILHARCAVPPCEKSFHCFMSSEKLVWAYDVWTVHDDVDDDDTLRLRNEQQLWCHSSIYMEQDTHIRIAECFRRYAHAYIRLWITYTHIYLYIGRERSLCTPSIIRGCHVSVPRRGSSIDLLFRDFSPSCRQGFRSIMLGGYRYSGAPDSRRTPYSVPCLSIAPLIRLPMYMIWCRCWGVAMSESRKGSTYSQRFLMGNETWDSFDTCTCSREAIDPNMCITQLKR